MADQFMAPMSRRSLFRMIGMAAIMRDVTKRFEEMRALRQKAAQGTKGTD